MNKSEVFEYLKQKNVWHEITEHQALFSMDNIVDVDLPYPDADAKNLFVRDDKKRNYYLITVKGDKRVDLKAFRKENQTRPLSFASEEDLLRLMGLIPGSVSPFGLLNDEDRQVNFFLDEEFLKEPGLIGIHPNENTATVWLKTVDLLEMIQEHGNEVTTVPIPERN
ncbi:prolyl-tRNA synthetase associated domain-containing protein [Fructobacillus evanidus]|uniref:YbaK-like aminoacyl-tRNA editing domain (ProX) n=1 Tax=Fructobacillus evanidus TaxID=3064281 RepID=A0ABM9MXL3_9LACO|nr:Predicted aminoacyl-tRNA deacylase [Fructobacillus sp. LMG 32999]CAK1230168.1 Predicted aminoacyl-tRNA deacylase [Fructobacillus sp. LMG 32999]CAK1230403.1 Predicted aminoacyl-tRNA deacylase [Fructobacillus sp. LMG 32999]CAK1231621.1 Predicted aminoacyl-tRNA deacylase [Fructobacillus sp. LMG 32999]CAK1240200.1 Predicted aminoacyl-tRNA deacylase [Fructobacillus sp. LMG 32999]